MKKGLPTAEERKQLEERKRRIDQIIETVLSGNVGLIAQPFRGKRKFPIIRFNL